ncbi:MAG TPA: hypothetical protein VI942_08305 [Thermoanaerobaculia bacterium]|nr:hypothetical protein [Thermoanaerobaculia bacterium]
MTPPPARVGRLLPGERPDLDDPRQLSRLIATLLEDGDRADLAWLGARVGRAELAAWFDRHAVRRLSRRSRAFWAATLGRPTVAAAPPAEALWPLA